MDWALVPASSLSRAGSWGKEWLVGALFPTDILLTVLVDAVCTVQAACRALSEAVSRILQLARLVPLASAALVAGCE